MAWAMDSMSAGSCASGCVTIIVVPTEATSVNPLQKAVDDLLSSGLRVEMIQLPEGYTAWSQWFGEKISAAHKCAPDMSMAESLKGLCFLDYSKRCTRDHGPSKLPQSLLKVCGYTNDVHYLATDLGMDLAVEKYKDSHDYILVTNADNGYHPEFFTRLVRESRASKSDVVASNFITGSVRFVNTAFSVGYVDLGSAIISMGVVVEGGLRFSSSIPMDKLMGSKLSEKERSVTIMRMYHDADWWYVNHAVNILQLKGGVVPQVLFYHQ